MRLWEPGPPKRTAGGMRFGSMGVYTAPQLPAPQTGVEMGRRALPDLQTGYLTTPEALTPRRAARKTYRITQPLLPTLVGALN